MLQDAIATKAMALVVLSRFARDVGDKVGVISRYPTAPRKIILALFTEAGKGQWTGHSCASRGEGK